MYYQVNLIPWRETHLYHRYLFWCRCLGFQFVLLIMGGTIFWWKILHEQQHQKISKILLAQEQKKR